MSKTTKRKTKLQYENCQRCGSEIIRDDERKRGQCTGCKLDLQQSALAFKQAIYQ